MKTTSFSFGIFALAGILSLSSCWDFSTSGSSSSLAQDELIYNYQLLTRYYLYNSEVGALSDYLDHGDEDDGKYSDVIYMYGTLSDQFTRYFTPSQAEAVLAAYLGTDDEEALIGVQMKQLHEDEDSVPDTLAILHVVPDSPADSVGIQRGDLVVAVDSNDVTGDNVDNYSTLTSGDAGTSFQLTILRDTTLLTFDLTKKTITVPTVWLDEVDSIPVIQVDYFAAADDSGNGGTADEFKAALEDAGDFSAAVIDLRDNPGGSVDQCMSMADMLLDTGVIAYSLERYWDSLSQTSKIDTSEWWPVTANSDFEGRYYVFLANGGSASCSELMLSGIRYSTDWPLVGDTTYGKGIAQSLSYTYANGLAVVTTTEFRTGDWQNYHHVGFAPDYVVTDEDSALALAVQLAKAGGTTSLARRSFASLHDVSAVARINARLENRPERPNGAWIRK
ncbi:MAG TPA: S41 family peptidase [Fibrobacteraceae bacterium]|nr:S41 family peptidase [Fibrobacteraceae bacterium]